MILSAIPRSLLLFLLVASNASAQSQPEVQITDVRIGFAGVIKPDCWVPIDIDIRSVGINTVAELEMVTKDPDGVPTSLRVPKLAIVSGQPQTVHHFVRIAESPPTIELILHSSEGVIARRQITPNSSIVLKPQPPETSIILGIGSPSGLSELSGSDSDLASFYHHVEVLRRTDVLPRQWFAYEAVDAIVMTTQDANRFAALDVEQSDAIRTWVRQGGRIIVTVGSNWQVAAKSFLSDMLPARIVGLKNVGRLGPEVRAIEILSASKTPFEAGESGIPVLELAEIEGQVIPSLQGTDPFPPVVVRSNYGLGTVTLVAFDPDNAPFREWGGRSEFWFQLLGLIRESSEVDANQGGWQYSNADIGGWVDQQLDRFQDVQTVPFSWVAVFILGYILLIGPVDYFLLKRGLGRLEWTWVTFPMWVVLVSVAAYFAANWLKGNDLRINRIEIVDVDAESRTLRGKSFVSIFSPVIERYTVTTHPSLAAAGSWQGLGMGLSPSPRVTSWLGDLAPVWYARSGSGSLLGSGRYAFSDPEPTAVLEAPIKVWSVKTFTSQWLAASGEVIDANLRPGRPLELEPELAGTILNQLPFHIHDAHLLWRDYAFHLGSLPAADSRAKPIELTLSMQRPLATLLKEAGGSLPIHHPWDSDDVSGFAQHSESFAINLTVSTRQQAGATEMGNSVLTSWSLKSLLDIDKAVLVGRVNEAGGRLWVQKRLSDAQRNHRVDPSDQKSAPPSIDAREQRVTILRVVLEPRNND